MTFMLGITPWPDRAIASGSFCDNQPAARFCVRTTAHRTLQAAAQASLAVVGADTGLLAGEYGLGSAGLFLVFALFTIATGFPHPVFGYVSMDRVAQVMSILILGPVDAAWINGLASFIFLWQRLRLGVSADGLTAALHNAG